METEDSSGDTMVALVAHFQPIAPIYIYIYIVYMYISHSYPRFRDSSRVSFRRKKNKEDAASPAAKKDESKTSKKAVEEKVRRYFLFLMRTLTFRSYQPVLNTLYFAYSRPPFQPSHQRLMISQSLSSKC